MKDILVITCLIIAFISTSCSINSKYTVAFYNVENLFDTIPSATKLDHEFTPDTTKNWNTEKYTKKISDLSKVISSIDKIKLPVLVGLCEIENDLVLSDLIADRRLKRAHYKYIWKDSPDMRGIDCALLYNQKWFNVLSFEILPVKNPSDSTFTTRDIILAKGFINHEMFYVFVNHWPSRREGELVSEGKRNLAASVVRKKVDEIFAEDTLANIIIMGDMNDEPSNESIATVLNAKPNNRLPESSELVNLMYDDMERGEGSYSYRGEWDMIDNLIVSGNLVTKKKGLKTGLSNGFIFHKPFMEFVNDKGQMSPNRTYGRTYFGGVSDHFPVYMVLKK